MSHTIKSVNSVGEGSIKLVNEIVKDDIKTMSGVHGFAGDEGGCEPYAIDDDGQLDGILGGMTYGTNLIATGTGGSTSLRNGFYKTASGTVWNSYAYTNAAITEGGYAYLEVKPTNNLNGGSIIFAFGLGYVDLEDGQISPGAANWCNWVYECTGGTATAAWAGGNNTEFDGSGGRVNFGATTWITGRTFRIQINDNTVTWRYSDDGFEDDDNVLGTSATALDIDANSNLIGAIAIYQYHNYGGPALAVIENLTMCGELTGT